MQFRAYYTENQNNIQQNQNNNSNHNVQNQINQND